MPEASPESTFQLPLLPSSVLYLAFPSLSTKSTTCSPKALWSTLSSHSPSSSLHSLNYHHDIHSLRLH